MTHCKDKKCPEHGELSVRGRTFTGIILSTKMSKTVTVEWDRMKYIPKYERYEKRKTRIKAHVPDCMNLQAGDVIEISECRPLSKTKKFVVKQKIGKEKLFEEKMELAEAAKKPENTKKNKEEIKEKENESN